MLTLEADFAFSGERMTRVLDAIAALRRCPGTIVMDNGPEMVSLATLAEAQGNLAAWRERYNTTRPHKALGWETPREFARSFSIARDKQTRHLSSVA
jgi:transposase InsO family protein